MNSNISEFTELIGYSFNDISLLKNALTHSSYANEKRIGNIKDNERLEFLGDAVLELVSSDYIFKNYSLNEGKMTKLRASIVCEPTLASCARNIELDTYIRLGKGEELTGGRKRDSIISDALEAVIGAIYLDGGFASAKEFVDKFILNDLSDKHLFYDSKSILQVIIQKMGKEVTYELVGEHGPEHNKEFEIRAYVKDLFDVKAVGHTKKGASQNAAYQALLILKDKGYAIDNNV